MKHAPGFLKLVEEAKAHVQECTAQAAWQRLQEQGPTRRVHVIDVREESEFAAGHAQGAEHLGRGVIERDIEARIPDHDTELILYCGGGYRSALAAVNLQKMGYRNVYSMQGGIRAWQAEGLPMST